MQAMRGDCWRNRLALVTGQFAAFPQAAQLIVFAIRYRRQFAASQWGGAQ